MLFIFKFIPVECTHPKSIELIDLFILNVDLMRYFPFENEKKTSFEHMTSIQRYLPIRSSKKKVTVKCKSNKEGKKNKLLRDIALYFENIFCSNFGIGPIFVFPDCD